MTKNLRTVKRPLTTVVHKSVYRPHAGGRFSVRGPPGMASPSCFYDRRAARADIGWALIAMLRTVTGRRDTGPRAWTGSWTGAPANPSATSAISAITRGICAASAHGARSRTSLNPRVRGSSPWRRTRSDLEFYHSRSFFHAPGLSRFPARARSLLARRSDVGGGSACPVWSYWSRPANTPIPG
jgi:hypothetical protein